MKIQLIIAVTLLPAIAMAQGYQGMSEADMQKMMQGMQEAQACMQGIDQARLEAFAKRAEQVESEIKALCASGDRDGAEKRGLAFGREVSADRDMQKMRKCGEKMSGMMPPMPYMGQAGPAEKTGRHICD